MEDRVGVFICTGYGIAEALDIDALSKVATGEGEAAFCTTVESCEGAGLESIRDQIKSEGLTRVVVAGISPRRYTPDAFPEDVIVETFGLRELVVWTQPPGEEDTQMMAEDYLRMYITKARKTDRPAAFEPEEPIDRGLLVVGGGITGMTAALGSAEAGYEVHLVEKTDTLGGWLARQHKSVPTRPPYRELEDTGVEALIAGVEKHPRIKVYTHAEVDRQRPARG
jgi:quinone-modifying oxidoreductase subunit QmoB